ncbi:MAG: hypothetical protein HYX29_04985 [Solirubrobacterales bacterium]|nr:hypothetical protein [Solirubrobacterales bacterium]
MSSVQEAAIQRLESAIELGRSVGRASPHSDFSGGFPDHEKRRAALRMASAINAAVPTNNLYARQAQTAIDAKTHEGHKVQDVLGIASALLDDLKDGYGATVQGLIESEVFADFLEMADEQLEKHYKTPAAVLIGCVLEERLRKLAAGVNIAVEREPGKYLKSDVLNAELKKADVYNGLAQKNVTAWLDLRNKAAHGKTDEFSEEAVALMRQGVGMFLAEHQ